MSQWFAGDFAANINPCSHSRFNSTVGHFLWRWRVTPPIVFSIDAYVINTKNCLLEFDLIELTRNLN